MAAQINQLMIETRWFWAWTYGKLDTWNNLFFFLFSFPVSKHTTAEQQSNIHNMHRLKCEGLMFPCSVLYKTTSRVKMFDFSTATSHLLCHALNLSAVWKFKNMAEKNRLEKYFSELNFNADGI